MTNIQDLLGERDKLLGEIECIEQVIDAGEKRGTVIVQVPSGALVSPRTIVEYAGLADGLVAKADMMRERVKHITRRVEAVNTLLAQEDE